MKEQKTKITHCWANISSEDEENATGLPSVISFTVAGYLAETAETHLLIRKEFCRILRERYNIEAALVDTNDVEVSATVDGRECVWIVDLM